MGKKVTNWEVEVIVGFGRVGWIWVRRGPAGGREGYFKFEMALLTSYQKRKKNRTRVSAVSGAVIPRTAPPRPIFARASVNGRENRAARASG